MACLAAERHPQASDEWAGSTVRNPRASLLPRVALLVSDLEHCSSSEITARRHECPSRLGGGEGAHLGHWLPGRQPEELCPNLKGSVGLLGL